MNTTRIRLGLFSLGMLLLGSLVLADAVRAQDRVLFIRQDFGVGDGPFSVTVGDFNGDDQQDLATGNFSNSVSILLGRGDGTFQPAQDFPVAGQPQSVTIGDFNGDDQQDLATANFVANSVSILLGQGDGTFEPAQDFGVGERPFSVTVGDFNGDGQQDVATANLDTDTVSILINNQATVVNDLVTFVPLPATFRTSPDTTGCPAGFVATFRFSAQLTTQPTSPPLTSLVVQVTTLTNGNLLQNAQGGPGGVGALLPVPEQEGFADNVLSPGAGVDVPFVICLRQKRSFQFFVDVLGVVQE